MRRVRKVLQAEKVISIFIALRAAEILDSASLPCNSGWVSMGGCPRSRDPDFVARRGNRSSSPITSPSAAPCRFWPGS